MPPFLLGESYGDARMGMARVLGFCFAILFASSVTAANIIDLGPTDYRNWGTGSHSHSGSGVNSAFGQSTRLPPRLNTLNVTRNAVIPYSSIANGMRSFVRINPASAAASAAVTAAFIAMDWYFDQDTGEWVREMEVEPVYVDAIAGGWTIGGTDVFPSPVSACRATAGCREVNACTPVAVNESFGTCNNQLGAGGGYYLQNAVCPLGSELTPLGCAENELIPVPLTSSDFQQLESELANMPVPVPAGAAVDIMRRDGQLPGYHDTTITGPSSVSGPETTSTSTDPVTGDTVVTTSSTTTNITYGDTTITTSNTTVTNTYTNGQQTGSETTTETPGELPVTGGGGGVADWPKFCDWATVVCDWLAWTQEEPPPEQDLPAVIDDDFFEQKRISFGSKSCPPDHEINLAPFLETTVGVSFQPLCDFAGLIYYMVMAASYIIAAYISIGVARNA